MMLLILEIGAVFLETQTELVLKSRKVVFKHLEETGFELDDPTVKGDFEQITA